MANQTNCTHWIDAALLDPEHPDALGRIDRLPGGVILLLTVAANLVLGGIILTNKELLKQVTINSLHTMHIAEVS
jgi:hypothetical protein